MHVYFTVSFLLDPPISVFKAPDMVLVTFMKKDLSDP